MSARAVLVSLLALSALPGARAADSGVAGRLDAWLNASGYSGSVLVARNGTLLLRKGYGLSDREAGRAYAPDTVYTIGSITKPFTAAAILKLEMQGKLKVEDGIAKYLPGVPEDKRGITIHQLLTHTAGLESDFAGDYEAVGRDEYVRRVLASKLRSAPGSAYHYANSGYSLLGAIIEIASAQPYESYLRANLFGPAGMKDTGYRVPGRSLEREAVGYDGGKRWGKLSEKPWADDGPYWALRANGGILSTVDDLHKWQQALAEDGILSAAVKQKMFAKQVAEDPAAQSFYGYGWAISESPWGSREIGHNGGNRIFSADFRIFPDDGLVVITSSNQASVKAPRAAGALARIAHGEEVAPLSSRPAGLTPLGTSPRYALARGWIDAFNTGDPAAMAAFRAQHAAPPPPDATSDEERARMLKRMHEDLGKLEVEGVSAEDEESLLVRARGSRGESVSLRFQFTPASKLRGVGVQVGD